MKWAVAAALVVMLVLAAGLNVAAVGIPVMVALIGWVALMLVSWFLIRPGLTDTSDQARSKMAAGVGTTHLLLVVMLYLMVFKPGL